MEDVIKEMLGRGEPTELECVDREGFLAESETNEYIIGLNKIVVCEYDADEEWFIIDVSELGQYESNYCGDLLYIEVDELKYFKIKDPGHSFNDLIDLAVQAVKDGILHIREITSDSLRFSKVDGLRGNSYYYCSSKYLDGIEHIKSLYFETFVIESEEDELRIKQPVKSIVLANGVEIIGEEKLMLLYNVGLCLRGGAKIPFSFLKGATVTQKRGA